MAFKKWILGIAILIFLVMWLAGCIGRKVPKSVLYYENNITRSKITVKLNNIDSSRVTVIVVNVENDSAAQVKYDSISKYIPTTRKQRK